MLQVTGLHKAFGARDVLDGITFHIGPRDRVGLVAANGTGKSTMLRILAGEMEPDTGTVTVQRGARVGYLSQEGQVTAGNTVRQELVSGRADLAAVMAELAAVEAELAALGPNDPSLHELVERHGLLQHRFDDFRGHDVEVEVGVVLRALGFAPEDADRLVDTFSGGWQMRIALGRLLIQRPDLLLLDEPTNHLDIGAVEWLEGYLRDYPGALLMVSHDRYILNQVTTRTFELAGGQVVEYAGNYSAFVAEKALRREQQAEAYERQQAMISRTQAWIDRFGAKATKASSARSRQRMLDKLERVESPDAREKRVHLRFGDAGRSGRMVLNVRRLVRRFDDHTVLDKVDLAIERGERVALVGPNGAGKSTLIRLLAGIDEPDGGEIELGFNVQPAYFAQHQAETLNPNRTALEELADGSELAERELRGLLGRFLFSGDDAFKPVSVLSGGERARLAFAKMLLRDANLLFLDEPTNHLDIASQEVLEQALMEFPGAIVLASHDRYLIDRIATKVIAVQNGGVEVHLGNYTAYRERIAQRELARLAAADQEAAARADAKREKSPAQIRRENAAARKRVTDLEAEIAAVEAELAELAARLVDPAVYADHVAAQAATAQHQAAEARLEALMAEWELAAALVPS